VWAWNARGQGHIVKFKSKGIELEKLSENLQKILSTLEKVKKKNEREIRSDYR
jgi:hypothetical protein